MSSAGAKALSYWKNMEKKNKEENQEKPAYNFKISRRRTNTLRRLTKKTKSPPRKSESAEAQKKEAVVKPVRVVEAKPVKPETQPKKVESPESKVLMQEPKPEPEPQPSPEPEPQPLEPETQNPAPETQTDPAPETAPVVVKPEPEPAEEAAKTEQKEPVVTTPQEPASAEPASAEPASYEGDDVGDECPFPCVAKYDFESAEDTELPLKAGEAVIILQISETGWCLAKNNGQKEGWVPMDFLNRVEDEQLEKKAVEDVKEAKTAKPEEPKRTSPLGEENQKLFEYLTTSQVFQQARSKGEMKVQIEDLHFTLQAGGSLNATIAIMRWLDGHKKQFEGFESLQKKIEEIRAAWAEHRMILKMKMKWSDDDARRVMEEGLGGLETLEILKGTSLEPEAAIEKIVSTRNKMKEEDEKGRVTVLDYLSTAECTLFKENCSVSQAALDAMFNGMSPSKVMEKVKALNAEGASFNTFEELVEAVSGKKVKSVKKGQGNRSFQPVLQYLSSPQCNLFRSAKGLRVTSAAIRKLLDAYDTDVQRLLCDVSILNCLEVQLQAFSELETALERKDVQEYKSKLFDHIKDPQATHFSSRPSEFPDDELYGILAVSTSRIDFLPLILKNLPEPASSLDDLCDKIEAIIKKMAATEAAEQARVVSFLSKFGLFSKQFAITVPLVQKLIWTSQFSKWGLHGGSVEDILKALHEASTVFDSFEALIETVGVKAEKMGAAIAS